MHKKHDGENGEIKVVIARNCAPPSIWHWVLLIDGQEQEAKTGFFSRQEAWVDFINEMKRRGDCK